MGLDDPLDTFLGELNSSRDLPPPEFEAKMKTLYPVLAKLDRDVADTIFDYMVGAQVDMKENYRNRPLEDQKKRIGKLIDQVVKYIQEVKQGSSVEKSQPEVPVQGSSRRRKLGNKFNRCVKSVRSTVRARKGSTKESAAIAICTKSVLQTRGLTMKRYRKKRLVTQKKFRGGNWGSCS
jgi:hypothetical protein